MKQNLTTIGRNDAGSGVRIISTNTSSYLQAVLDAVSADLGANVEPEELAEEVAKTVAKAVANETGQAIQELVNALGWAHSNLPVAETKARRLCCAMIEVIDARAARRVDAKQQETLDDALDPLA